MLSDKAIKRSSDNPLRRIYKRFTKRFTKNARNIFENIKRTGFVRNRRLRKIITRVRTFDNFVRRPADLRVSPSFPRTRRADLASI